MLISELSFPHLQAAHEARLSEQLERRRVISEILDEEAAIARAAQPAVRYRRNPAWARTAVASPPCETCPA
jgi:hypothetical protein